MKSKILFLIVFVVVFGLGVLLGFFLSPELDPNQLKNQEVYAIFNGEKIRASDVLPEIQGDLEQLEKNEYTLKKRATEDFIRKKWSQSDSSPTSENIEISDQELSAFLKERNLERKKLSERQLADILGNLKLQKRKELQKQAPLQGRIQWKIPLPSEPVVELEKGILPAKGPEKASLQVILVSNLHCPTCQEAEKRLQEIRNKYKDQFQVRYRFYFQEPDDSVVRLTAEAALCANDEGKFWEFHDQALKTGPTDLESLMKSGQDVGLNIENLKMCLSERKHRAKLEQEIADIQKLGLVQAPSFVINGRVRSANLSLDELSIAIDQELP